MRKHPPFTALRAFEAAARLTSFTSAAEELHLTPSAVSHQIKHLETFFGKPLFVRHSRHIEVTSTGQRLQQQLRSAFDNIERACAEVSPAYESHSLAVHSSPSFASKWLGPRLPSFMQLQPSINIRLSSSAAPIDLLRHEELDVLIVYGHAMARPGLTVEPLSPELVAPLVSPRIVLDGLPISPAQLSDMPLIDSELSPVTWPVWFGMHGVEVNLNRQRPSFDRGALVISAALDGLGVALETTRFAQQELLSGDLVIATDDISVNDRRPLHFLCYRSVDGQSSKISKFRDWLLGLEVELN